LWGYPRIFQLLWAKKSSSRMLGYPKKNFRISWLTSCIFKISFCKGVYLSSNKYFKNLFVYPVIVSSIAVSHDSHLCYQMPVKGFLNCRQGLE
jgi:hypothetical protein